MADIDEKEQPSVGKTELDKLNEELELYEKNLGLEKWQNTTAPIYLNISIEDLRKKPNEELSEAVYLLAQYSLNIQRAINRNKAWQRWGYSKIDQLACENFDKIGNSGWQERMLIAKNGGESSKKMQAFLLKISMRIDRLHGIVDHIKLIMDSIRDIKFSKMRQEKEFNNNRD